MVRLELPTVSKKSSARRPELFQANGRGQRRAIHKVELAGIAGERSERAVAARIDGGVGEPGVRAVDQQQGATGDAGDLAASEFDQHIAVQEHLTRQHAGRAEAGGSENAQRRLVVGKAPKVHGAGVAECISHHRKVSGEAVVAYVENTCVAKRATDCQSGPTGVGELIERNLSIVIQVQGRGDSRPAAHP